MTTNTLPTMLETRQSPVARAAYRAVAQVSRAVAGIGGLLLLVAVFVHLRTEVSDPTPKSGAYYGSIFTLLFVAGGIIAIAALIQLAGRHVLGRSLFPGDWMAIMLAEQQKGRPGFAVQAARMLVEQKPENTAEQLMVARGHLLLAEYGGEPRSWAAALAIFEALDGAEANDPEVLADRALALQKLARFGEAIEVCDRVLVTAKTPPSHVVFIKALCQEGQGDSDAAAVTLEELRASASQDPDGPQIASAAEQRIADLKLRTSGETPAAPEGVVEIAAFLDRPLWVLEDMISRDDGAQRLKSLLTRAGKERRSVLGTLIGISDSDRRRAFVRAVLQSIVISNLRTTVVLGVIWAVLATPFAYLVGTALQAWRSGTFKEFSDADAGCAGILQFLAGPLALIILMVFFGMLGDARIHRQYAERLGPVPKAGPLMLAIAVVSLLGVLAILGAVSAGFGR